MSGTIEAACPASRAHLTVNPLPRRAGDVPRYERTPRRGSARRGEGFAARKRSDDGGTVRSRRGSHTCFWNRTKSEVRERGRSHGKTNFFPLLRSAMVAIDDLHLPEPLRDGPGGVPEVERPRRLARFQRW